MKKILSLALLALTLRFSQTAFAQNAVSTSDCWIWVNEGTGETWKGPVTPEGTHLDDPRNPNHASRPSGAGYVRVPCPPPDAAQNAGHTIKKILEHVSIGVGGDVGGHSGGNDRLVTDHKAHKTDQHTSDKKLSDAQKNATASSDKNRVHDHKKPTPTPTPRH